jgi:DNA-binding NarL/FixJ family response regulator
MIRIVIVDDHPVVLEGLKSLLQAKEGFTVAGCLDNGKSVLPALETLAADVVLLDINLPDINGIELCKEICRKNKGIRVIALSIHNERAIIMRMLESGAAGYVLKNAVGTDILQAIEVVMEGQVYFCSITREIMHTGRAHYIIEETPHITRREAEILRLLRDGKTTREIAVELSISFHTVESHRKNLMSKFGVNNIISVIKIAAENKLL